MASTFRTLELSDPAYEQEGLRYITVKTPNLAGRGDLTVWLPPSDYINAESLPLVILLHGVYGSHWAWTMKGGAHRTAAHLIREGRIKPVMLAMPSDGLWGDGSGYLPHSGYNFEHWIIDDVPNAVAEALADTLPTSFPQKIFIAGLSMGGFGALRLAAKYPDRFQAVSGLSSITHLSQLALFVEEPLRQYAQYDPVEESVAELIIHHREHLPPIRFDCGIDDDLIEHNRTLHRTLVEYGVPHEYVEYPGGHEWPYWEKHLADTLLFFNTINATQK
jgi:S-formylglutathione hydrolase FrmB